MMGKWMVLSVVRKSKVPSDHQTTTAAFDNRYDGLLYTRYKGTHHLRSSAFVDKFFQSLEDHLDVFRKF